MAKNLNTGRQWALINLQPLLAADLVAGAQDIANLPHDAIIVGGALIVNEVFDGGLTIAIGGAGTGATLGATAVDALGLTALVLDGTVNTLGAPMTLTLSGAATVGAGYLEVEYVRPNRANEVQE